MNLDSRRLEAALGATTRGLAAYRNTHSDGMAGCGCRAEGCGGSRMQRRDEGAGRLEGEGVAVWRYGGANLRRRRMRVEKDVAAWRGGEEA